MPLLAESWELLESILKKYLPLPIELSHFGIFPGPAKTLFLGGTPSRALLELHRELFEAVRRDDRVFPYYRSENLVFHCTLCEGVNAAQMASCVDALDAVRAPGHCEAPAARLMEYSSHPVLLQSITTSPA